MGKIIPVSIGILLRNLDSQGVELWMQQRKEEGPLNDLWEFPGGKIEAGESPEEALKRELWEEIQLDFSAYPKSIIQQFKLFPYSYLDRSICLYVYYLFLDAPFQGPGEWFQLDFKLLSNPLQGQIPEINHIIIDELMNYVHTFPEARFMEWPWNK